MGETMEKTKKKQGMDSIQYQRTQMQKNMIIQQLKDRGCRITRQRRLLIDIILESDCGCCKEIYYKAVNVDKNIGVATVYRMINTLEEIGAISRKNMYKIACSEICECKEDEACIVRLDDDTEYHLSAEKWHHVIQAGMEAMGYLNHGRIISVSARKCNCKAAKC
ncbi:MAG: transcriptional repressor [Eubacteriales bacterium]|nr:transcriptional repressor [Eubacteriales bacterium]